MVEKQKCSNELICIFILWKDQPDILESSLLVLLSLFEKRKKKKKIGESN